MNPITKRKLRKLGRKAKRFMLAVVILYAIVMTAQSYFAGKTQQAAQAIVPAAKADTPASAPAAKPDKYAILEKIAQCESGNDYGRPNNTTSAFGKYQIMFATWNEMAKITGHSDKTNPEDQEINARMLYDLRGTKPWDASKSCWSKK